MNNPIRKILVNPIQELARHGQLSGLLLILATVLSLLLSNSESAAGYLGLWQTEIGIAGSAHSLVFWINDALMPLFFLLVGIEIKRELSTGELSKWSQAILPVVAAIGGVALPAVIYFYFNHSDPSAIHGWAIPTATDIAFSLAILSLLGKRVPFFLKVFLTALAIIDDLIAILIIALFYSGQLHLMMILYASLVLGGMILLNYFKVRYVTPYLLAAGLLWYFVLQSGIHPTIAGVVAAFAIPASLAHTLEEKLYHPVYYFVLPVFALANTAIPLSLDVADHLLSPLSLGIILGLFLGKPAGIFITTFILSRLKISKIPKDVNWKMIIGMGFTAGIGFTMSIFIATLSFKAELLTHTSKLAIIAGSLVSAIFGAMLLYISTKDNTR